MQICGWNWCSQMGILLFSRVLKDTLKVETLKNVSNSNESSSDKDFDGNYFWDWEYFQEGKEKSQKSKEEKSLRVKNPCHKIPKNQK